MTGHRIVIAIVSSLIIISLESVILESVLSLWAQYEHIFVGFEALTVTIFTVEYALSISSCTENGSFSRPILGRLRYAVTIFALVDLLAILPFFLSIFIAFDARFLRILGLVRILRIAKRMTP